ncbi:MULTISPECIES: metallophosphoesterase family protein [unclassified Undibacterium]|uniref:metallophosphoesterase family protein n=1 Tax=unclassified Undibacterium TaxID=2630295 RepID=UPI002AC90229|nr:MULTISPECIES: metallophosphoesterase [unclassified Undibacterium]MEB0140286.1 metallophosphoesterase [Undibacterium sp. CCC2.1]MEB0173300.1 metallophosphoesterase [Undibacterium sp. CCC1.1]MEB0177119.1 metallophosphoesterase [Undibacterium sp. CCC3.4]MEB0216425.1 metallophosphoesterase [Undibacterium sp. 5I2]WPX45521.1 metallophosphoesterase [Undibacterium sp. CCC3.4]
MHCVRLIPALLFLAALATSSAYALENPITKSAKQKLSSKAKSITIYAAGDIADCKKKPALESMAARTADLIATALAQDTSALAITLGDNTYPVGKPEEFSNCYDPTWGRFKQRTLPSPGNHDYAMPKALGYYNYFGELAGPDRRGYYAKHIGNWQIISLNSNLNRQQMQTQLAWLQEELSNNKQRCTLAFWHHPAFSSGGHGNNELMWPAWKMLVAAKADLVLSGHDHDYERFAPMDGNGERDDVNGLRSFVVGTGGAATTPMFLPKNTTEMRDNSSHGVLRLKLQENSYEWEFLATDGASFGDKGKGVCH